MCSRLEQRVLPLQLCITPCPTCYLYPSSPRWPAGTLAPPYQRLLVKKALAYILLYNFCRVHCKGKVEWRDLFGFWRCFCHKSGRTQEHRNGLLDGGRRFCFPFNGKFFPSTNMFGFFKILFFFFFSKEGKHQHIAFSWPCDILVIVPSEIQLSPATIRPHLSVPQIL